jgi:hypothetical protein
MVTTLREADSLLAIDVGDMTTRAILFDAVEGRYRYLATGSSPTTVQAPFKDVREGVRLALAHLEGITGRKLISEDSHLLIPEQGNGAGIDKVTVTLSAGAPLRVVLIGLLEEFSVQSAWNLASTIYAKIVDTISINDQRAPEARLDALIAARPDVIILTGGIDGGAWRSVLQFVDTVRLACKLLPNNQRPVVLYTGNRALVEEVKTILGNLTDVRIAPNIFPVQKIENLEPARVNLANIYRSIRMRQLSGMTELDAWTTNRMSPTAASFGRIIRFLSKLYDPAKGVLGLMVGSSAATIATAFSGELSLRVYPQLGLGAGLPGLLEHSQIYKIANWLPTEVSEDYIRDYIYNKTIYPASLPFTAEDLAIEQALARQVIQTAIQLTADSFPKNAKRSTGGTLPWFEPILVGGSGITNVPSPAHAMMLLLDALQPTGVTTLVLDQSNLSASLGSAASLNPILVVQVLESSAFLSLGTVISPIAHVRHNTPVLRLRVIYDSGDEIRLEVKQGNLEAVPLPMGQSAQLYLQPLHRADVGMGGPGIGGNVRVMGGALGVVIDARGRPLHLPEDLGRRRELFKRWSWTLGG